MATVKLVQAGKALSMNATIHLLSTCLSLPFASLEVALRFPNFLQNFPSLSSPAALSGTWPPIPAHFLVL